MFLFSKFKKQYLYFSVIFLALFLWWNMLFTYWQWDNWFYYGTEFEWSNLNENDKTDLAKILKDDSINTKETSLLFKIREYFRLTWNETYDQETPATWYIKMIMNMALWLTSFISLVLIIYAFYLMFFQKQEEWFAKAKKILAWVAIALLVMWLSWIIVSFFFEIYSTEAIKNI